MTKAASTFLCLILLFGCSKNHSNWDLQQVNTTDLSRLIYQNNESPIEASLEMLFCDEEFYAYFNVHNLLFSSTCQLNLSINDRFYEDIGTLCSGHQRIKIEQKIADKIIKSLLNGQSLTLFFDQTTYPIDNREFSTFYNKLHKQSSFFVKILPSISNF